MSLDRARPTVVLFAHPNCPCTRASLEELGALFRREPGRARLVVTIVQPAGLEQDPDASENAVAARGIAGAIVQVDPLGREARRFGAATSGQVVVYDAKGVLRFRGGVTDGRGHLGPNAGIQSVAAILEGRRPGSRSTPVFGCSLLGCHS